MNTISKLRLSSVAFLALFVVGSAEGRDKSKTTEPTVKQYTLELVDDAGIFRIVDINNKEEILIERKYSPPLTQAPLILKKNGKHTAAFECPGTTNDSTPEGLNNRGDIVGHCGHDGSAPGLFAFIANPKNGSQTFLAYPGAIATWGYGINDFGQVVGFYSNDPYASPAPWHHPFVWDPWTDRYYNDFHPPFATDDDWSWLTGINNKGQIVGHYQTIGASRWQEYQFLYDQGTFLPIEVSGAVETHITGINNNSQILGWYSRSASTRLVFLYEDGEYFDVDLPLPANAPRPDGLPAGVARLIDLGGMNDNGQFVGTYSQIVDWEWETGPFGVELVWRTVQNRFVATPRKWGKN